MEKVNRPKCFEDSLDNVLGELRELMISKQKDYGPKNITTSGEVGILVRMSDKLERWRNLFGFRDGTLQPKKEVNHESLTDTKKDIANYAIISVMLERNEFELPLRTK